MKFLVVLLVNKRHHYEQDLKLKNIKVSKKGRFISKTMEKQIKRQLHSC